MKPACDMLTIAYLTNREFPNASWFFDSLRREAGSVDKIVVVDFYAEADERRCMMRALAKREIVHVPPMPNVWNGPHRLTEEDWFAAASVRNTALCYAPDGFLAYVDDLSVLVPGWMASVQEAMAGRYVALGAYRKVRNLVVEDGKIMKYDQERGKKTVGDKTVEFNVGDDTRLDQVTRDVTPCSGGWLYGCSLVGHVQDFLSVGGWPSDLCDGLGSEDCCMGHAMKNAGCDLRYDRRMMTFESEEGHWHGRGFKKADKGPAGTESDKSHKALRFAEKSRYFHNYSDIPVLRQRILQGGTFPVPGGPTFDWFDGSKISEFQ